LLNSQVLVPRRRLSTIARHVIHYSRFPDPERGPPFELVVSPDGRHGVLTYGAQCDGFDEQGVAWPGVGDSPNVTAFNDFVLLANTRYSWNGGVAGSEMMTIGSRALARRMNDTRIVTVWIRPPGRYWERETPETLLIADNPRVVDSGPRSGRRMEGVRGVAAIATDFTVFVAGHNRRLMVFKPGDDNGESRLAAGRDAGIVAQRISLAGSQVILLAREGTGTRLRAFTERAKPTYTVKVPFQALQPAVAGAAGRIYLAGKGLAAIDNGKMTWTHDSKEPLYVSSFEDGSLAVANGKRLDFIEPNGVVDQTFESQEPLVAPPAIAGDGSVWAASATAIYVAR